jgi:hypothetical protein
MLGDDLMGQHFSHQLDAQGENRAKSQHIRQRHHSARAHEQADQGRE